MSHMVQWMAGAVRARAAGVADVIVSAATAASAAPAIARPARRKDLFIGIPP